MLDYLDNMSFSRNSEYFGIDTNDYYRKKVNYDLMNNIINPRDFEYVTKPWGDNVGELPAQLVNRDIISPKIKALLGMEARRPFNWKVTAVNEEATTRKEQEETNRLKDFVVKEIMRPLIVTGLHPK